MESTLSRINILVCTFVAALATCAAGNFVTSLFYKPNPSGVVEFHSVLDIGISPYLRNDQANIAFNMKISLKDIFQWNTNQLFVYVYATYQNQDTPINNVIIWDHIISNPKLDANSDLIGIINEYPIRDIGRHLRNQKFKLNIAYCYMPIVGFIHYKQLGTSKMAKLPSHYFQYNQKISKM
ncbi:signal peptidase subunit family protein [Cryptosporidium muris RN66]|uniref:Signal peptidase complex subunit 3 n=1 Tax=Cryptosporidium muris (strain RN66) TaxID=441375 RepID=B6AG63_CRYMR|nr:signal peptidase subunit family protein [Cryptosporidium muris RN66]EEA07204.1 signal peptidase subunit family protein [Cryptosporidium muris RN66]|eukprot:XP_002141553.1 signal peptidase subunit family protein [Cryptosporidium muris RN66]